MKYTFVDTCFTTHHLNFARDANDTLWASAAAAPGRSAGSTQSCSTRPAMPRRRKGGPRSILDTNGNGKRDDYVEPNQPVDPTKDKRIGQVFYAVMVSPADGSIWGTLRTSPGSIVRLNPGSNPPETALAELYNIPMPGFGPRGADIDSQGVVWVSLASGHMGMFDRRKCKVAQRPDRDRQPLPRRLDVLPVSGPAASTASARTPPSRATTPGSTSTTRSGLGNDMPISTANLNDGLVAFKDGKMITMKVPYPTGFYAKGLDGRIDDPNAGWKGRGLWVSSGDRVPWLQEGGKGMKPMAVHFQVRPDPLAK